MSAQNPFTFAEESPEGPEEPGTFIELLMFEIAGEIYAAEASQIRRIDRPSPAAIIREELGTPLRRGRVIVFDGPDGEAELLVDRISGVANASLEHLRRMPPIARSHSLTLGLWLGAERPILLIDLPETARVSAA